MQCAACWGPPRTVHTYRRDTGSVGYNRPTVRQGEDKRLRIRWELTLVFGLALLVRVLCVEFVLPPGYFLKYPALLQEIRGGLSERAMDGSFVYLMFHWACQWVFRGNLAWPHAIQIVSGSLSAVLLAAIGCRLWGRAVGILGGCFAALYSGFIIHDSLFEPESFLILFTLGWAWLVLPAAEPQPSLVRLALGGAAYGLALATRPTILLALPFLLIHVAIAKRRWQGLAVFCSVAMLPLGALLLFNWNATGHWTMSRMNPGEAFFEGNNPNARGALSAYPLVIKEQEMQYQGRSDYAHSVYRQIARSCLGLQASVIQCNDYWMDKAMEFMRTHPMTELRIVYAKLRFLLSAYEAHDVEQGAVDQVALGRFPLLGFGVVVAFGLPGAILAIRRGRGVFSYRSGIWIPYVLPTCFSISNIVFFVSARQRLHIVPFLVLFAAVTVAEMFRLAASRRFRSLSAYVACAAVIYVTVSIRPPAAVELDQLRRDAQAAGSAYRAAIRSTNVEERATHAVDAVASAPYLYDKLRPAGVEYDELFYSRVAERSRTRASAAGGDTSLLFNAAIAELLGGDCDRAAHDLKSVLNSGYPVYRYYLAPSSPHHFLGLCAERGGRASDALQEYALALAEQPGSAWSLSRRADLLRRLGRTAEAAADLATLDAIHDPATVHLMLGTAAFEAGDWGESASHFRALSVILPDYMKARVFLMASLKRAGDPTWPDQLAEIQRFGSTLAFPEASYPR